ncbi:MAG: hypothetical protein OCD03_02835 [Hyphomicrobiales bacterium]
MKTIEFTTSLSGTNPDDGVDVNYTAGQLVSLTPKTADMFIAAKVAVPAAKKGKETQHIKEQTVEIVGLKDELLDCKGSLDDALARVGVLEVEVVELGKHNAGMTEIKVADEARIAGLVGENTELEKVIADMRNLPMLNDEESVDDRVAEFNAENEGASPDKNGDGQTVTEENAETVESVDQAGEASYGVRQVDGIGEALPPNIDGAPVAEEVAPAVDIAVDGKKTKRMPKKQK